MVTSQPSENSPPIPLLVPLSAEELLSSELSDIYQRKTNRFKLKTLHFLISLLISNTVEKKTSLLHIILYVAISFLQQNDQVISLY